MRLKCCSRATDVHTQFLIAQHQQELRLDNQCPPASFSSCCCCCTAVHCTRKTVSGRCISLMTWRYRANCLRHFERSCRDNKTAQTTRMSQTFEWDIHRLPSSLSHIYQPLASGIGRLWTRLCLCVYYHANH